MNLRASMLALGLTICAHVALAGDPAGPTDPAPTAKDWAAVAALPDWSGVWTPDVIDQNKQIKADPTPWNAKAGQEVAALVAAEAAGHPKGLFVDCLPNGMPALIVHRRARRTP